MFAFVEGTSFDVVRSLLDGEYISHCAVLSILCCTHSDSCEIGSFLVFCMIGVGLKSWSLFILYLPSAERLDTFPSVSCIIGRLYTISDPWNSGDNYCVTAMHTGVK